MRSSGAGLAVNAGEDAVLRYITRDGRCAEGGPEPNGGFRYAHTQRNSRRWRVSGRLANLNRPQYGPAVLRRASTRVTVDESVPSGPSR